jgi:hypothetical protein
MQKIVVILIFLFAGFTISKAQTDSVYVPKYSKDVVYKIVTNTDLKYSGYIIEENSYGITIKDSKTQLKIFLYNSEISSITPVSNTYRRRENIQLFEENEHCDTYMLSSSSFLFEPGEISSSYHWGVLNSITFPIDSNWAITANTLFIYPFTVGVKCAYRVAANAYLGGTVFGMGNIGAQNSSEYFLGYGAKANFTKGNSNVNYTISGGVLGINFPALSANSADPFLNLYFGSFSYCNRFSRLFALNTELWYFPEAQSGFLGLALKLVNNEYYSWTFGCFGLLSNLNTGININSKALPIPYIGYSQKF